MGNLDTPPKRRDRESDSDIHQELDFLREEIDKQKRQIMLEFNRQKSESMNEYRTMRSDLINTVAMFTGILGIILTIIITMAFDPSVIFHADIAVLGLLTFIGFGIWAWLILWIAKNHGK